MILSFVSIFFNELFLKLFLFQLMIFEFLHQQNKDDLTTTRYPVFIRL